MKNTRIYRRLFGLLCSALCIGLIAASLPQMGELLFSAALFSVKMQAPGTALETFADKIASIGEKAPVSAGVAPAAGEQEQAKESAKELKPEAITVTPDDILALQKAALTTFPSLKKKGSISEKDFSGKGTVHYGKVAVNNKIKSYTLDIKKQLETGPDLRIPDKSKPTVLIYHTHTTEAFQTLDKGYYTTNFNPRSMDKKQNMVRVGDEIAKQLEAKGFSVIHDTNIYDETYTNAYYRSDDTVKKYMEQYPSIEITIDVHRDSIQYDDGTKAKPTATIAGKKAAQVMLIAGCETDGITGFPDWEYNLRMALMLQKQCETMYPGLMRPVYFCPRVYNMNETRNSLFMEIGTDGNTLEEAAYSGRMMGSALAAVMENYVEK